MVQKARLKRLQEIFTEGEKNRKISVCSICFGHVGRTLMKSVCDVFYPNEERDKITVDLRIVPLVLQKVAEESFLSGMYAVSMGLFVLGEDGKIHLRRKGTRKTICKTVGKREEGGIQPQYIG